MSCGSEGSDYRYRVSITRGVNVLTSNTIPFFGEVGAAVEALLQHLARPDDTVQVEIFQEEE